MLPANDEDDVLNGHVYSRALRLYLSRYLTSQARARASIEKIFPFFRVGWDGRASFAYDFVRVESDAEGPFLE